MIYSVYLEHVGSDKLFVVVSNNQRNRNLDEALAAGITTSLKPHISSIIEIDPGEPVHGRVLCDDIELIYREDVQSVHGGFSPRMMAKINDGLRAALNL